MKKENLRKIVGFLLVGMVCLSGCGTSQNDSSVSEVPGSFVSEEPAPAKSILNPLTGNPGFCETAVGKRPVAVMVNNIGQALPHRGLSKADIIYEVVVEGGITRMMAVFADQDHVPYVGPVRSARHYYIDLALPYNSVFVHFGGSPAGYERIQATGIDHIDGMTYSNSFYQDKQRAQSKGREHSFFISSDEISALMSKAGISEDGETTAPFLFSEKELTPTQLDAQQVFVAFSGSANSSFSYNRSTGLYKKQRNGEAHIDADTGKVLQYKNILILYTSIGSYNGESYRREVSLTSGNGYYVTNGGREPIQWTKGNSANQFSFTRENGEALTVNPGKTYICIVGKDQQNKTAFSGANT